MTSESDESSHGRYCKFNSRSIFLAPFACAGIGFALARLSSERLWLPIALAMVLGPAGFIAVW